ncbi:MAG: hypothetical protein ACFFAO_13545 [Candidatus Hermodarchaeota archaeon]
MKESAYYKWYNGMEDKQLVNKTEEIILEGLKGSLTDSNEKLQSLIKIIEERELEGKKLLLRNLKILLELDSYSNVTKTLTDLCERCSHYDNGCVKFQTPKPSILCFSPNNKKDYAKIDTLIEVLDDLPAFVKDIQELYSKDIRTIPKTIGKMRNLLNKIIGNYQLCIKDFKNYLAEENLAIEDRYFTIDYSEFNENKRGKLNK